MNNFFITFMHTLGQRVKSKAFIVTTTIMVVAIIAGFHIVSMLLESDFGSGGEPGDPDSALYVVDQTTDEEGNESGIFGSLLENMPETYYLYVYNPELSLDEAQTLASEEMEDGENEDGHTVEGVILLEGDAADLHVTLYGEGDDFSLGQTVNQDVNQARDWYILDQLSLNEREQSVLAGIVNFSEEPLPTADGEVQTFESYMQSYWMVYGLVFAIYMIIIFFGSMIATEVATEKSSRVMELIVSSINPVTQMFGKLFGIGVAGFLNLAAIAVAIVIGAYTSGNEFIQQIFTDFIDYSLIGYAILLILLGYLLYGGLAAMLGALVSRAEDVNQAIQPIIFIAMIAFFVSIVGLNTPDAGYIQVLSYIPFFTPQLLFLRIGMTAVPTWEIILILAILVISAYVVNLLAARVYKGGVLMYGKFSIRKGIKQALKLSK